MIVGITSIDKNGLIGCNKKSPWENKTNLQHFNEYTKDCPIIFGRKTFENFPDLSGRKIIVMTKDENWIPPSGVMKIETQKDLDFLLEKYRHTDKKLFIGGGAEIFKETYELMDYLIVSEIVGDYEGDTSLPDFENWFEFMNSKTLDDEVKVIYYKLRNYNKKRGFE